MLCHMVFQQTQMLSRGLFTDWASCVQIDSNSHVFILCNSEICLDLIEGSRSRSLRDRCETALRSLSSRPKCLDSWILLLIPSIATRIFSSGS